ncbi:hypothetical protein SAMN03097699_3335 [Flavobacteriaceae bacterium MAR_2010_188]|nr:hypothetical protein SAMN03097699_3335 [Flavobacteriaceae bacterium MAR_2010_188]
MLKPYLSILFISVFTTVASAQENLDDLLAAGIQDAKTFTTDYIAPAEEGVSFGINNGWFNNAKLGKKFGFELSLIGNISFIKDDKKDFELNINDYNNVRFEDNSDSKMVATALGHNDPPQTVIVTYDDPLFGNQEVELVLPTGIGSQNVNLIPTAFLQASFSIFEGTQLKARYFPRIDTEDTKLGLYGLGIQQEFTSWLPVDNVFPVAISGVAAYTHLDGSYDFTDTSVIKGANQRVETDVNTFLLEMVVGTKLPIINFYGGLGYITGKTKTSLLGTYIVTNGILFSEEIEDPFTINGDVSGIRATLGTNLKLGFFGINADYTMAEFDSASLGINFSF